MAAVWTEAAHISQMQTNRSQFFNSTLKVLPTPAKGSFTAQVCGCVQGNSSDGLAEDASQRMPQSAPAQQPSPGALHRPLTLAIAERAKANTLW